MARVTVEDCIDKVDSPYELVLVAKERAARAKEASDKLAREKEAIARAAREKRIKEKEAKDMAAKEKAFKSRKNKAIYMGSR